jgi:hypothetical protein
MLAMARKIDGQAGTFETLTEYQSASQRWRTD